MAWKHKAEYTIIKSAFLGSWFSNSDCFSYGDGFGLLGRIIVHGEGFAELFPIMSIFILDAVDVGDKIRGLCFQKGLDLVAVQWSVEELCNVAERRGIHLKCILKGLIVIKKEIEKSEIFGATTV